VRVWLECWITCFFHLTCKERQPASTSSQARRPSKIKARQDKTSKNEMSKRRQDKQWRLTYLGAIACPRVKKPFLSSPSRIQTFQKCSSQEQFERRTTRKESRSGYDRREQRRRDVPTLLFISSFPSRDIRCYTPDSDVPQSTPVLVPEELTKFSRVRAAEKYPQRPLLQRSRLEQG